MRLLTVNAGSTSVKVTVLDGTADVRSYASVAEAVAPAMNFLPGEIANGSLRFALATIPLDDVRNAGERVTQADGRVLVGIRPEDFEDAALAGERGHGIRIKALIDVLESTGSDRYAHLSNR